MFRDRVLAIGIALAVAACAESTGSRPPGSADPSAAVTQSSSASPPSSSTPPNGVDGTWTLASPMRLGRVGSDAVLLSDGRILVVGDDHDCQPGGAVPGSERAEIYDPTADLWADVGSLNKPRKSPATVVLPDGSALVVGGINPDDVPYSSTKRFEAGTGTWTDGPLMSLARGAPLAVTLADGRVLVASSDGGPRFGITAEILDPATGLWSFAASPGAAASLELLVRLDDGKLLGIGSDSTDSEPVHAAWLYDPAADAWESAPAPEVWPTHLIAVPNGSLVLGFSNESELAGGLGGPSRSIGLWLDRAAGQWAPLPEMGMPRFKPQVVGLPDGRVLVAGGRTTPGSEGAVVTTAETYDPATNSWSPAPDLLVPRQDGHAIALGDGSILIFGGSDTLNVLGDTPFCPPGLTTAERFRLDP